MCGIAGLVNLNGNPAESVLLRKMTDAIAHRGPDGEGIFTDRSLGLGHRRLAIIDLSPAGRQPMQTPLRFIPTRVGNTDEVFGLQPRVSVHPHARGEHTSSTPLIHRGKSTSRISTE